VIEYDPISAPRTAEGLISFPDDLRQKVETLIARAEASGDWRGGADVHLELSSPEFWAYWIYKTKHPIAEPHPDEALKSAFRSGAIACFETNCADEKVGKTISMSFAGDLMAGAGIADSKDHLFEHIAQDLFASNISFANLESTLTTGAIPDLQVSLTETPIIAATAEEYAALTRHKEQRFDILQLANNHILDFGLDGVETTLEALRADGIEQVGVNESEDVAGMPRITNNGALKIGWIAHTFSVNFKDFPEQAPWIVNMTPFHLEADPDTSAIERQVRLARQSGCEFVIVTLHWGLEFELFPHRDQVKWARRFADCGADLIVGHHPHVPQPMEIYTTRDGAERCVPIIYSLGNLTGILSHPASVLSLIARLDLTKTQDGISISRVSLKPVVQLAQKATGALQVLPLTDIEGGRATVSEPGYAEQLFQYADLVIGPSWREVETI
jgi:hypothetical protein